MKTYDKDQIIKEIKSILEYYSNDEACLRYVKLLLDKVYEGKEITLSKDEITQVLFDKDSKKINVAIFNSLRSLKADLEGVSFDDTSVCGLHFNRLENVVINLDKVLNKDLSKTKFEGVTLYGSLDGAVIDFTDFNGYIGNLVLNPQKVKDKSIKHSKLSGITIDGSFDLVDIIGVDFTGAKGTIRINPQNVPNKQLVCINFADTELVGNYNEETETYDDPSFKGLKIYECKFKNAKGNLVIDLNEIDSYLVSKLFCCDLTGVVIKGNTRSKYPPKHSVSEDGTVIFDDYEDDLTCSYYEDKDGNKINIHLFESRVWNEELGIWQYIPREEEPNLQFTVEYPQKEVKKQKILSLFKKRN